VETQPPPPGSDRALLLAHGPQASTAWSLDLATAALAPRVSVGPTLAWHWDGQRLAWLEREALAVVDASTAAGVRVPLPRAADDAVALAVAGDLVALAWPDPLRPGAWRIDVLALDGR
jgi:hypothetical protein